jgi:hypothetical protein
MKMIEYQVGDQVTVNDYKGDGGDLWRGPCVVTAGPHVCWDDKLWYKVTTTSKGGSQYTHEYQPHDMQHVGVSTSSK